MKYDLDYINNELAFIESSDEISFGEFTCLGKICRWHVGNLIRKTKNFKLLPLTELYLDVRCTVLENMDNCPKETCRAVYRSAYKLAKAYGISLVFKGRQADQVYYKNCIRTNWATFDKVEYYLTDKDQEQNEYLERIFSFYEDHSFMETVIEFNLPRPSVNRSVEYYLKKCVPKHVQN